MNVRDLCRLLSATLHLPSVDRWAEQLGSRELLPGLDHEVNALDAALLLMAGVIATKCCYRSCRGLPTGNCRLLDTG